MAWIESHTTLEKHHKVIRLRLAMRWSKNETIGFLHRFWWTVLEVSPSGDITALSSPEVMAEMLDMEPGVMAKVLQAMEHPDPKQTFLDRKGGRLLVHDWLDSAWTYLSESKFKRHPEKLAEIRRIHQSSDSPQAVLGPSSDSPRNVRDTNQTNQPDQRPPFIPPSGEPKKICVEFEEARKAWPGVKRGYDVELANFVKQAKNRKLTPSQVLPLLLPAVRRYKAFTEKKARQEKREPFWQNFKTWVNNQGWTAEYPGETTAAAAQETPEAAAARAAAEQERQAAADAATQARFKAAAPGEQARIREQTRRLTGQVPDWMVAT